jgi:hypothetical protein
MKDILTFGHLLIFFFVTKFQSHESQHDHRLLSVANAPIYGLDSNNAIENFVDKYISYDNNKLAPIFVKLKHIVTKKLIRRKIKSFVNLIFHGLLWKNLKFFNHS